MARALTSFILDLSLDEARAARFGGLDFGDENNAAILTWLRLSSGRGVVRALGEIFGDRVALRRSGVPSVYATTPAIFRGYGRHVPAAKAWRSGGPAQRGRRQTRPTRTTGTPKPS